MKGALILLAVTLFAGVASADYCYKDVLTTCAPTAVSSDLSSCNAKFSAFHSIATDMNAYTNAYIEKSYEYLLLATYFGNYQKSRVGFTKLFQEMSDKAWESAQELIKYITKRGGHVNFSIRHNLGVPNMNLGHPDATFELFEMNAMARALDTEKALAEEAHRIHGEVTRRQSKYHDPQVGFYLEKEFMNDQVESIRKLSGHTNDLKRLLEDQADSSLALFLFDEYLQSS